jgi:hypothetical protein
VPQFGAGLPTPPLPPTESRVGRSRVRRDATVVCGKRRNDDFAAISQVCQLPKTNPLSTPNKPKICPRDAQNTPSCGLRWVRFAKSMFCEPSFSHKRCSRAHVTLPWPSSRPPKLLRRRNRSAPSALVRHSPRRRRIPIVKELCRLYRIPPHRVQQNYRFTIPQHALEIVGRKPSLTEPSLRDAAVVSGKRAMDLLAAQPSRGGIRCSRLTRADVLRHRFTDGGFPSSEGTRGGCLAARRLRTESGDSIFVTSAELSPARRVQIREAHRIGRQSFDVGRRRETQSSAASWRRFVPMRYRACSSRSIETVESPDSILATRD